MEPTPLRFITVGDVVGDYDALVLDASDLETLFHISMRPVAEEARQ
jgi:hypothetical protein